MPATTAPAATTSAPRYPTVGLSPTPFSDPQSDLTVTTRLDRTAARVGETVTVTAELRNTGATPVTVGGGCQASVPVKLEVLQGAGPSGPSRVTGKLDAFRATAVADRVAVVDQERPLACARGLAPRTVVLQPGAVLTGAFPWTATTVNSSAYDGAMAVRTYVECEKCARYLIRSPQVGLKVTGGDPARLTPVQALDAALADDAFAGAVQKMTRPTITAAGSAIVFGRRNGGLNYTISYNTGYDPPCYRASTFVVVTPTTRKVGQLSGSYSAC